MDAKMSREEFYRLVSESKGNESNICQIYAVKNGRAAYEASWRGFKTDDAINVNSVTKGVIYGISPMRTGRFTLQSVTVETLSM